MLTETKSGTQMLFHSELLDKNDPKFYRFFIYERNPERCGQLKKNSIQQVDIFFAIHEDSPTE